jgi:hypothetical protein
MRARNIKPGFFSNDALGELPPMARILFIGLWCQADREGRLEDRPKRIRAEVLPYDDVDVDSMLNMLAQGQNPFIVRYAHEVGKYIQIVHFLDHQKPHPNEAASTIPALHTKGMHPSNQGMKRGQPKATAFSTKDLSTRADIMNPDILNDDIRNDDTSERSAPSPPVTPEAAIASWNQIVTSLPKVTLTDRRRKQLKVLIETEGSIERIEDVFRQVRQSEFLSGRNGQWTGCGIDWVLKPTNWTKIREGNYANRSHSKHQNFDGRDYSDEYLESLYDEPPPADMTKFRQDETEDSIDEYQ